MRRCVHCRGKACWLRLRPQPESFASRSSRPPGPLATAIRRRGNMRRFSFRHAAQLALMLGLTGGLALAAPPARAQNYPNHVVKIVVPYPAGGTADVMPRILADWLSRKWGQSVIIENRSGAGGNVGAEVVAKSDPDGYTLLASPPGPLVVNQNLYQHLEFDPLQFVPIVVMGRVLECARGQPGQDQSRHGQRFHRLREGQSRQDHVCDPGQRHDLASDIRAVSADGERQVAERAVSRLGAGAQRSGFRQRRCNVRQSRRVDAIREGGQAEAHCGRRAGTTQNTAERADHCRNLAGLRLCDLVCAGRTAEDARGDRRQDQCRRKRGAARSDRSGSVSPRCRPSRPAARRRRPPPIFTTKSIAGRRSSFPPT